MTTSWSYTGIFFLMCIFPPWQKLFSLEMFQQYTANILPLWNSAGKFCNLKKHLGHLTGVSMDLQTRDQKKKKKKKPQSKYFWSSSKGVGWCVWLSLLLFSRSGMSDSLQPHGLQHTRLPCPSLSLGVCSNSCPLWLTLFTIIYWRS